MGGSCVAGLTALAVETITEDLTIRDNEFNRLRRAAVFGDQARAALMAIADDLPPAT